MNESYHNLACTSTFDIITVHNETPDTTAKTAFTITDECLKARIREIFRCLSNLCRNKGFAWISNKKLAAQYRVTLCTVKRWIRELRALGLIVTEFNPRGKQHKRKIFCVVPLTALRPEEDAPAKTTHGRKNDTESGSFATLPSRAPVISDNLPENITTTPSATPAVLPLPDPAVQTALDVVVVSSVTELSGNTGQVPIAQAADNPTVAKPYRTCIRTPTEQSGQPEIVSSDSTLSYFHKTPVCENSDRRLSQNENSARIPAAKPCAADNATPNAKVNAEVGPIAPVNRTYPDSSHTPFQQALDALQAAGLHPFVAAKFVKLRGADRCLAILAGSRTASYKHLPSYLCAVLTRDVVPGPPATAPSATQGACKPAVRREVVPTGFRTAVEMQPPTARAAFEAARARKQTGRKE